MTNLVAHLVMLVSNLTQACGQEGTSECSAPTSDPEVLYRNFLNIQEDHTEQPVKNLSHHTTSTR